MELAFIFKQFDGKPYDRDKIVDTLKGISPRSSFAARDPSKFRDEISAYPAYLGLYHLEQSAQGWIVVVSSTAKAFLLKDDPDVGSFMRLQLSLFQYPNGIGVAYRPGTNSARMQANTRTRTLSIIDNGIHLSPLRMICRAIEADSALRSVDLLDGKVGYDEIYALANSNAVNKKTLPSLQDTIRALDAYRSGQIGAPNRFEKRFHILRHTEMFEPGAKALGYASPVNPADRMNLLSKINAVLSIQDQFDGFDSVTSASDFISVIASGQWGKYYDGMSTLHGNVLAALGSDIVDGPSIAGLQTQGAPVAPVIVPRATPLTRYALLPRPEEAPIPAASSRQHDLADPEVTRIKRQRRNLEHKRLIDLMDQKLRSIGSEPKDNPHIDMYAEIPGDGAFIFEMKSGGENLLEQIRKGLSQLYEYRYRYRGEISTDTSLCLVLPKEPDEIPWILDYLCGDREINVCWFDQDELKYPETCKSELGRLSGCEVA